MKRRFHCLEFIVGGMKCFITEGVRTCRNAVASDYGGSHRREAAKAISPATIMPVEARHNRINTLFCFIFDAQTFA